MSKSSVLEPMHRRTHARSYINTNRSRSYTVGTDSRLEKRGIVQVTHCLDSVSKITRWISQPPVTRDVIPHAPSLLSSVEEA